MTKPGRWAEASVRADRAAADDLASLFRKHCCGGAAIEDTTPGLGDGASPRDGKVTIKGFLPVDDEETRRRLEIAILLLSQDSPISPLAVRILEPEDWSESWKAYFPPQKIGQRLVIVPTWREYQAVDGDLQVRLDPGMAFGTGLHATTRLCLCAVERLFEPGWRVLDVGTGSGILSVAAALLGARQVHALDVDPVAVDVARHNVSLNGVGDAVSVALGTLGTPARGAPVHEKAGYDLVLVNILAGVIARMAPALSEALATGGLCVASGIIEEQADTVVEALERQGLSIEERLDEEGWVALIARRP